MRPRCGWVPKGSSMVFWRIADRQAGRPLAEVFPHLGAIRLFDLVKIEAADWNSIDLVFCALPHGTTQTVIAALPRQLKVVDLSADFRLADLPTYAQWYRHAHEIEQGLSEAAGRPIIVNFTPHLAPMSRGILATIYVRLAKGGSAGDLRKILGDRYADEPFVR